MNHLLPDLSPVFTPDAYCPHCHEPAVALTVGLSSAWSEVYWCTDGHVVVRHTPHSRPRVVHNFHKEEYDQ